MKHRIDDIEVLRAFAVLLVVLHHSRNALIPWSHPVTDRLYAYLGGWSGVDLFFAISGFIIARDLIPRLHACADRRQFLQQSIGFWIRRAYRLVPSAWICLAFIVTAAALFNASGAFGSLRANITGALAAVLQLANLYFATHFGNPVGFGATFHFWSLSLEEQFYLALPFAIFFGGRALPWLAGAAITFQLLSDRPNLYYWSFRSDAMLLGVMIAWWSRSESYRLFEPLFLARSRMTRLLMVLFLTAALGFVASEALHVVRHRISVIAVLSALLVLIASYDRDYVMAPGILKRTLMWVGARSYAIYLWHVPVFFAIKEMAFRYGSRTGMTFGPDHTAAFLLAGALLLALVAEVNYRVIETPLRRRGKLVAQRWLDGREKMQAVAAH
jgi:peptidoglycan/LPS O-acetylase OafA/YrhL